jgi:trans-2,3-dihydro-3-hydroxyanthranilate isomerase
VVLDHKEDVATLCPAPSQLAAISEAASFNVCAGAGDSWKTRMFSPAFGVPEDPATGSAAGPLALHLARHGLIPFGQEIRIEQGAELGRPSTLYARPVGSADHLDRIDVGGAAVVVARGEFHLP